MSQPDEMPTTDFFESFIKQYGRAWDNYDLQTILRFYYTPCFIFKSGTVFANVTEEIKLRYFLPAVELRANEFTPLFIEQLPVFEATREQQTPIIKLVDRILTAKRKDAAADTSTLEREIDALVYQLYRLTEEEIAIVEGK